MARHLLIALAAICCVPTFAATPTETLAHFHQALKSGDTERAKALLKPEIQIYESGHVERSRDEYVGHHLPSDMAFAKETDSKVLKQQEQVSGNLAVVMQETETTGKFKGKPVHLYGTETVVMEKHGDGWVFSHVHWSSRKAAK